MKPDKQAAGVYPNQSHKLVLNLVQLQGTATNLSKQERLGNGPKPVTRNNPGTVIKPSRGAEGNGTVSLAEGKAQALSVRGSKLLSPTQPRIAMRGHRLSAGRFNFNSGGMVNGTPESRALANAGLRDGTV